MNLSLFYGTECQLLFVNKCLLLLHPFILSSNLFLKLIFRSFLTLRNLGIYREVYLMRKPAQFIADYEFTSDITIPIEASKKTKKAKKVFSVLDDFIDNIDEGKNDIIASKSLSANVNINILTEGMTLISNKINDKSVAKEGKSKIENGEEELTYAVRAEIFENNTTQHGAVLTLTGVVMKVGMYMYAVHIKLYYIIFHYISFIYFILRYYCLKLTVDPVK